MRSPVPPPPSAQPEAPAAWAAVDALPEYAAGGVDVTRARAFAEPLIAHEVLDTGENTLEHADAVAHILSGMGASTAIQAASYLVYAANHLAKPQEAITKGFGEGYAQLAVETNKLVQVQLQARTATRLADAKMQTENVRRMLLAFSRDLRVVMLRLASRLQSLRYYAASKVAVPPEVARESLLVFAPLANRLGIWQIKWELEDLAFRFLEPETYKTIARELDEKRQLREAYMSALCERLTAELARSGVAAEVSGRPKHIYSIVRKMRGKNLAFSEVMDVRALRILVANSAECYAVLAHVHAEFEPVAGEFDDYIARPKVNGYQSLHTVVRDASSAGKGRPLEIQIRTPAMHQHAETGVAAHWAYKEAGAKGYAGVAATSAYDAKLAMLRQLLAWERELSQGVAVSDEKTAKRPVDSARAATKSIANSSQQQAPAESLERIYVLTPDAAVVDLAEGATPIDFAYAVHTNLGHRCRGARVDGAMVPLQTPLQSGQTVEIVTAKEGGPSRDWLNPELAYVATSRAKSKVRAWFNAQASEETVLRGREVVEKLLQREGKTALKLDDMAALMQFKSADALFEAVGKDEVSQRSMEQALRPPAPVLPQDEFLLLKKQKPAKTQSTSGVLVVGVDSLLTQMAKCCKAAPPDEIAGFVTRGKGVSIHRVDCSNFEGLSSRNPERVIDVAWGQTNGQRYRVDVQVAADDRTGLLRDISEVLAKEKCNVVGVQTQSVRPKERTEAPQAMAWMTFTLEVEATSSLPKVLREVLRVSGVVSARRR